MTRNKKGKKEIAEFFDSLEVENLESKNRIKTE